MLADSISIRGATRRDAVEIAAIGYTAWELSLLPVIGDRPGLRQAERRRFGSYAAECFSRIFVADTGEEIVGWVSYARGRPYIPFIFVAPHAQGQGIGSLLLGRAESFLELMGHDRVHLETPADHINAVSFYERRGYKILAMKVQSPSRFEPLQRVRMEKQLNPAHRRKF